MTNTDNEEGSPTPLRILDSDGASSSMAALVDHLTSEGGPHVEETLAAQEQREEPAKGSEDEESGENSGQKEDSGENSGQEVDSGENSGQEESSEDPGDEEKAGEDRVRSLGMLLVISLKRSFVSLKRLFCFTRDRSNDRLSDLRSRQMILPIPKIA